MSLAALRVHHMTGPNGIIKHMTKACIHGSMKAIIFSTVTLHARLPTDLEILVDKFHVLGT